MEKIKGLSIDLDIDHLSVDRGLKGLKDNISTVNSEMRRNMSAFDRSERSVQKYETRITGLNKKLDVQKRVVAEAKKEYEDMVEQHGRGSKEAEKAAREYNNQAAALNNLERYIENAKKELIDFEKEQRIANSSWTKMGDKLEGYGGKLKGIGEQMNDVGGKLTRGITVPALGAAGAVGGIVSAFGWKRLTGLDSAQAQLKGLGYSTEEVGRISEQVTTAIDGGMTTMAEGTAVAAGALAAGVKEGKELERYIKLVGDAATGANRPVEDMAMIFNRVQGSGKLMTRELNMIEQGMPGFSKALSKHLGISSEKLQEMVTDGKVSTKDFLNVMEDFAGGMASAYAESWDGMVANTKAYIGIIGENFLRGVFNDSKKSLADFIELLKSPEVQQKAQEMGDKAQVAFNKMKDSIMGVVEWYQNLDDGQKIMLKRIGLIAVAGGPALQFLGKFTSGLGTTLEFASKLSKSIGVARGAGLVAGLTSLGPGAVAGVAVVGIAAVGTAIYQTRKKMREGEEGTVEYAKAQLDLVEAKGEEIEASIDQIEQTSDLIEGYYEQEESINKLVDSYDGLLEKSKLTSSEFGEFIDLQEELSYTKTPERVDEINDRLEALREKSGLSKDELKELLDTNKSIDEFLPGTTTKVDNYGNSYSVAADEVRELIGAELELKRSQMYEEIVEDAQTLNREASKYKDIAREVLQAEEDVLDKKVKINEIEEDHIVNGQRIKEIESDRESIYEEIDRLRGIDAERYSDEIYSLGENARLLTLEKMEREDKYKIAEKELDTLNESLETDQERLDKARGNQSLIDEAYQSHLKNYEVLKQQLEEEAGITVELGKENELIDKQIEKNEKAIDKLQEKKEKHGDNDGEIKKQIEKLIEENELLDESKDTLSTIGEDLLNSGAHIDDINGSLVDTNKEYSQMNDEQKESNTKLDLFNQKVRDNNREIDNGTTSAKNQGTQFDINNQKIDDGKRKAIDQHKELTKPANKLLSVNDKGTIADIDKRATASKSKSIGLVAPGLSQFNQDISAPVTKTVNIRAGAGVQGVLGAIGYAKGTPPTGHPGGHAVMGDGGGSELVTLPGGSAFLSADKPTLYPNLPKGTHVTPHRETKHILKSIPFYANGTDGWQSSEFSRLLMANSRMTEGKPINKSNSSTTSEAKLLSVIAEQNEYLKKSNELLTALLGKDLDLYKLNKKIDEGINDIGNRNKAAWGGA